MPHTVTITGSFSKNDLPVQGLVRFTPGRFWVVENSITWACLAPEVTLDPDGSFSVQVTPTDTDDSWWRYLVDTPAGRYEIAVPWIRTGYSLRELIYEHHPGTWPENG